MENMLDEELKKEDMPEQAEDTDTAQAAEPETEQAPEQKQEASGEEETAEAAEETEEKAEKSGFFKKKDDKEKNVLKDKIAELEDRTKRQMAEFENFRKRSNKEKEQMFAMGERSVIEKILPVVDNFERGLSTIPEEEKGTPFADGMEMIYRQLMTQLDAMGVKSIEAVGQDFDPNLHNAVMQVDSEEYESGKVAQELQKGYMYHDTVVRHSMVGVVK